MSQNNWKKVKINDVWLDILNYFIFNPYALLVKILTFLESIFF